MKKLYQLALCITLTVGYCFGMDMPQKAIHPARQIQEPAGPRRLNEAKPLKEIAFMNVMQQITTIMRESIADPDATQKKIDELLQNARGDVLNLITAQLYNQLKLPIIDQLVQFPLITIPETENYFVSNIEFDPSGTHCMVLKDHIENNRKQKLLEIYTIPSFELIKKLSLDCSYAHYSPQGKFLNANKKSKKESKIILLDIRNDFKPYQFDIQDKVAYSFNPQEDHLLTCNQKGIVKLLDISTQQEITPETQIYGYDFPYIEPVNNYIIALSVNKKTRKIENIILISEKKNELQQQMIDVSMYEISSGYCQTALYPAKNLLALSSGSDLFIYDLKTDQLLKQFSCEDSINNITFHPSGEFVAVASDDWTARIWNIKKDSNESSGLSLSVEDSRHVVQNVSFSPITDLVLSSDGFIRLWDISTPQPKLISSIKESSDDSPIIICPNTDHGLLFTKSSAENIWFAPTSNSFNVQQLVWIYDAWWAKKNLKGEKLKLYLENLNNMINIVFSNKNTFIKTLLHKIVSSLR